MSKIQNSKRYDLEERTFKFAENVRNFIRKLPKTLSNIEDMKQLVRASGSVGANYIEANESLSKKDFLLRIKICRKEAKESIFWLKLICAGSEKSVQKEQLRLINEGIELMKIFSAIMRKSSNQG